MSSAPAAQSRRQRVGEPLAWEVTKRTTERDRELAWLLYRHRILRTDQIQVLFFSSRRRCQDRLLWLYRHRVIDRFYPSRPFALGKVQAHWLLDEVGAYLVAARLGKARRQLAWDRQRDFHAHAQLAHRVGCNEFVCGLIAATLDLDDLWVGDWGLGFEVFERHWGFRDSYATVRPDASLELGAPYGLATVVALEWDRGTEPLEVLCAKVSGCTDTFEYLQVPRRCNVCFVVPTERRAQRLMESARDRARRAAEARFWITSAERLERDGPLSRIWQRLDHDDRPYAIREFEVLDDTHCAPRERALGRRWQPPLQERWATLSPLGGGVALAAADAAHGEGSDLMPAEPPRRPVAEPEPEQPSWIEQRWQAELEQARRDAAAPVVGQRHFADEGSPGGLGGDLRVSGEDGLMDDPDEQEEPWA